MKKQIKPKIDIHPETTALLLMHWQNDIATKGGKIAGTMPQRLKAEHIIDNMQAVLKYGRDKGMTIIYINAAHRPGYPEIPPKSGRMAGFLREARCLIKDTWGARVINRLKPRENEIMINNFSSSAFCYTELDLILRNKGITDIVLTGLLTNWIVESTARDGANRGYFIYTLEDCCRGMNKEMHDWAIKNTLGEISIIITSKEFVSALDNFSI